MVRIFSVFLFLLLVNCCYAQLSYDRNRLIYDLRVLSADSLEGRRVGSEGNRKARVMIMERLRSLQIEPLDSNDYLQPFSVVQAFGRAQTGNGANILAVIEGKKEETFVISAHYDHVGIISNMIYNGADDNASGTAALLAFAEFFKMNPPEHRIILAFFDAEEVGLKGSAHFVNSVDLKAEKIVLNINMDMISRSDVNELYASGTYHTPALRNALDEVIIPEGLSLLFGHDDPALARGDWTSQSDHMNFHRNNIPFLYFGVEDHADYHQPTDTFERIDIDFYLNSTETILRVIKALDKNLK
jgi:Zn-dependent M28 family amino/carboxypeptidase